MNIQDLVNHAFDVTASAALPLLLAVLAWAIRVSQARWHFTMSQQTEAAIDRELGIVVDMGIGWGRAKLAAGQMGLNHVTTGNEHIDQIANAAFGMLSEEAKLSGITSDDLARRIVAGIGHVLGNDPSVKTIGVPAPVVPVPETLVPGAGGSTAAAAA